jgi:two-component sensor histidine kinase
MKVMQRGLPVGVVRPIHHDDILVTPRLYRRRARPAALEAELAAYHELSSLMALDPVMAIQRFLDLAIQLCPAAGSAGLSEIGEDDDGQPIFKWTMMSGAFAPYVGGTTPRNFSPCGLCLDNHHTILVERPARVFDYFNQAEPPIVEGLIVPLYDTGKRPLGTLWVTSHDRQHRFDATDARIMEQLAVQLVLAIKLRRKAKIAAQLEESARENRVLVEEVRHRVKNMIQMATSLLHLQERGLESAEARASLSEARGRLVVLSTVYETLLHPGADARYVDAGILITSLAQALRQSTGNGSTISIRTDCDSHLIDASTAVPLGLIVNEAITNSLKHAFAAGERGEIAIAFKCAAGRCALTIADDGRGFDGPAREGSLGMRLMTSLARQLGARFRIDGSNGTTMRLDWSVGTAQHFVSDLEEATA